MAGYLIKKNRLYYKIRKFLQTEGINHTDWHIDEFAPNIRYMYWFEAITRLQNIADDYIAKKKWNLYTHICLPVIIKGNKRDVTIDDLKYTDEPFSLYISKDNTKYGFGIYSKEFSDLFESEAYIYEEKDDSCIAIHIFKKKHNQHYE